MDEQMIYNRIETILQKMSQKKQLQSLAKSNGIELNELELNDDTTDAVVVSVIALMLAKMDEDERYKQLCDFGMQKRSLKVEIINDYKQRANMLYNKFKNRNNPVEVSITIDEELPVEESFEEESNVDFILEDGKITKDSPLFTDWELTKMRDKLKSAYESMKIISEVCDKAEGFHGHPVADSNIFDHNKKLFMTNDIPKHFKNIFDNINDVEQDYLGGGGRMMEGNPLVPSSIQKTSVDFDNFLEITLDKCCVPIKVFVDNMTLAHKENVIQSNGAKPGVVANYQKFRKALKLLSPSFFREGCNKRMKLLCEFSNAKFYGKHVPSVSF